MLLVAQHFRVARCHLQLPQQFGIVLLELCHHHGGDSVETSMNKEHRRFYIFTSRRTLLLVYLHNTGYSFLCERGCCL